MKINNSFKTQFDNNLIEKYSNEFNLHTDVIKLLFSRNLTNGEEISEFLSPPKSLFFDPFLLKDMQEVVAKINKAVKENKKIVVLGDYDTDGISASAILFKYFQSKNVNINVFLPNRLLDGYGLTKETLDKVFKLYSPDLIITVDCGISCPSEVEYCLNNGVDIIVTDHHDIPDELPKTLIINAKLKDQNYPFKELCGAGIAFKLVQALEGLDVAMNYLTIASLATVADIVPLVSENRAIVFYGLKNQDNMPNGLKQLCKILKISMPLSSTDIAYKLAPKINASGRMGDASISFKLYVEENKKEIDVLIKELLAVNDKRVTETNNIYEDALNKLSNVNISTLGAITLYDKNWESGVLGIICSKLVEKFNKPVCLLSWVDGEYKGSCRSVSGISITDVLNKLKDLLIRFGGHSQAGGLSVTEENVDEFCRAFNNEVLANYSEKLTPSEKKYDLEITENVSMQFLEDLQKLEPFGLSNEAPIFKITLPNNTLAQRMANYPNHLKLKVFNIEMLGFSLGDYFYNFNSNCKKDILCDLFVETYNKRKLIKGHIKNVNFGFLKGLKNKEISNANYLLMFENQITKSENNFNKSVYLLNSKECLQAIENLTKTPFGTLVIAYSFETYKKAVNKLKNITNYDIYNLKDEKGINTLLFAPETNKNFKNYTNVVLLDFPLCDEYLYNLPVENVYVLKKDYPFNAFKGLSDEYADFANYHFAIKSAIKNKIHAFSLHDYFTKLKALNPQLLNIRYDQFVCVYLVLRQLGIINKVSEFELEYDKTVKSKLTNSSIYNNISALLKGYNNNESDKTD